VIVEAILFFWGCEVWKWVKRVWFRRQARKGDGDDLGAGGISEGEEQDVDVDFDVEKGGAATPSSVAGGVIADERVVNDKVTAGGAQ